MFNQNQNNNFMDAINIVALLINVINLLENEAQSAYNDVHAANNEQEQRLLSAINARLDKQDAMLQEILEYLKSEGGS